MYQIVYMSIASHKISEDDLINILIESRRRNIGVGITGMLLFIEKNILQVIEGEEGAVTKLYNAIVQDTNHNSIIKITDGQITERNFDGWYMGFKSSSFQELDGYAGYKNISRETLLTFEQEGSTHPAIAILKAFYQKFKN